MKLSIKGVLAPRDRPDFHGRYFRHLFNHVYYRHALPLDPIASSCRADGVGEYWGACRADTSDPNWPHVFEERKTIP